MNTIESWDNFTRYYGGIVGARDCFELVCEDLLKRENPTCEVHRIKASRGDGGIDIHVSNGKLVQIYQCKFFECNAGNARLNARTTIGGRLLVAPPVSGIEQLGE